MAGGSLPLRPVNPVVSTWKAPNGLTWDQLRSQMSSLGQYGYTDARNQLWGRLNPGNQGYDAQKSADYDAMARYATDAGWIQPHKASWKNVAKETVKTIGPFVALGFAGAGLAALGATSTASAGAAAGVSLGATAPPVATGIGMTASAGLPAYAGQIAAAQTVGSTSFFGGLLASGKELLSGAANAILGATGKTPADVTNPESMLYSLPFFGEGSSESFGGAGENVFAGGAAIGSASRKPSSSIFSNPAIVIGGLLAIALGAMLLFRR